MAFWRSRPSARARRSTGRDPARDCALDRGRLARNSPHPYAAVLFYDFLISDGQKILASRAFLPASRNIETPSRGRSSSSTPP